MSLTRHAHDAGDADASIPALQGAIAVLAARAQPVLCPICALSAILLDAEQFCILGHHSSAQHQAGAMNDRSLVVGRIVEAILLEQVHHEYTRPH
jgi:hypothetical protein